MWYSDDGMQPPREHNGKNRQICVAISGESVVWAAIEAVLRKEPDIDVTRCWEPEDWHRLLEVNLDVVLFDASAATCAAALSMLRQRPGLTMIQLDFDKGRSWTRDSIAVEGLSVH